MAKVIQLRRGTAVQHATFVGAPGEVTVDTSNKSLHVHDGNTPGGNELASRATLSAMESSLAQTVTTLETNVSTAIESVSGYGTAINALDTKIDNTAQALTEAIDSKDSGLPLLSILWDPSSLPKEGYLNVAANNGVLSRSAFPQAAEEIQRRYSAGDTAVVTDSVWMTEFNANGGICNKFSIGNGSTTFRVPCIPGCYPGAPATGQTAGQYLGDAIRNITGRLNRVQVFGAEGAFSGETRGNFGPPGDATSAWNDAIFSTANVVPTADVNRPKTAVQIPFMKMYGTVVEEGEANIAELIQSTTGKLDSSVFAATPHVVETWRSVDGLSWYRKYSDGWVEQGGEATSASALPIGAILNAYTSFDNCIVAFGGEFSRADYPKLWTYLQANPSLLKTQAEWTTEATANGGICGFYSDGNGTTTFRVPNLDKAFLRPDSRGVVSYQGDEFKSHNHALVHMYWDTSYGSSGYMGASNQGSSVPYSTGLAGGNETRPKNIAVLPLIVAK